MNSHEIITTVDGQFDEVRDEYGRFLALIDENGSVVMRAWYPPTNRTLSVSETKD